MRHRIILLLTECDFCEFVNFTLRNLFVIKIGVPFKNLPFNRFLIFSFYLDCMDVKMCHVEINR